LVGRKTFLGAGPNVTKIFIECCRTENDRTLQAELLLR